eukprot:Skav205643  [mRNA]  locus=scaffold458:89796:91127:+ [translate_table: standard]
MAETFRLAQDRWSESLISDEDLCDAVALVGSERRRVPFIRAHLATLSKPLRAALYGEFREAQPPHELVLEDVTLEAFDVIIRSAYHLDPKLTPVRALHALKAAKVYMIEELEKYCWHYLRDLDDLDCSLIFQTFTLCLKHSIELPEEVQHIYWSNILAKSSRILESPFFVQTHGSIIASLVKLDEIDVSEEALWDSLVAWSSNAVQNPELLGPFEAATPSHRMKHSKTDTDSDSHCSLGANEVAQQQAILQMMSPYIRFTTMTRDFFIDKARKFLDRERSEAVMDFFVLGRVPPGLPTTKRGGLKGQGVTQAQNFTETNTPVGKKLTFSSCIRVARVEVTFLNPFPRSPFALDDALLPKWSVTAKGFKCQQVVPTSFAELKSVVQVNRCCNDLMIELPTHALFGRQIGSINVEGFNIQALASQEVQRLSKDLLVTPSSGLQDP